MSTSPLGRTLVIANPAAHSGRGAQGATFAERFLASYSSATRGYELRLTTAPGDAELMAAEADGFDTVVALGGDGVIHEVANGLMRRPAEGARSSASSRSGPATTTPARSAWRGTTSRRRSPSSCAASHARSRSGA